MFAALIIAVLLITFRIYLKLTTGRCTSPTCLAGKTALITGGNSGIGFQTALALAERGCRVIIADRANCDKSKEEIIKQTGNTNIVVKQFDLSSLNSVRKLAKDVNKTEERLDILINNAGAHGAGNFESEDGLHIGMQINHFAPFLLTHLLVGLLKKSAPSRIIFVASESARATALVPRILIFPTGKPDTAYCDWLVYSNSKLCTIITANQLAKKLEGTGVTVNSLHPGLVKTPLIPNYIRQIAGCWWQQRLMMLGYEFFMATFMKDEQEGAQTTLHLALAEEVGNVSGKYFADCKPCSMPYFATDLAYSKEVWETSENLVKLEPEEKL